MKVLFQCNAISPYRNDFFNELAKLCDLTVCFETENSEHTHRDKKWFEGMICEYKKIKLTQKNTFLKFKHGNIEDEIKKGYDCVILGNYLSFTGLKAVKTCKKYKTKVFVSADGALAKKDKFYIFLLKKHILRGCDGFLSPSEKTDEYFLKYGVKKEKIHRYNFTNLKNGEILPYYKRENNPVPTVFSVGQFIYRKGFDLLIKACYDLRVNMVICGGRPTQEIEELCKSLQVKNATFLPFKTKSEIAELYKKADIFVLPTREDNWGLVINEAMNYSLPVITTDKCVAGLELITSRGGFITPSENVQALKDGIVKLFDYDLRQSFGKYNNEKIKENTVENMAKAVIEAVR